MKNLCKIILFTAVIFLLPAAIHAQTIKDITLGAVWLGDEVKLDAINGEVIAIEFWGYN